jgi:hypothetical protein
VVEPGIQGFIDFASLLCENPRMRRLLPGLAKATRFTPTRPAGDLRTVAKWIIFNIVCRVIGEARDRGAPAGST